MRLRWRIVIHSDSGTSSSSTSASCQQIGARIASAPPSVTTAVSRYSGPWCASSVMEKRSLVMRLMSTPVRLQSKKRKLIVCRCSKSS